MTYDLILTILLGALTGAGMYGMSRMMIRNRTGQPAEGLFLGGRWSWIVWTVAGSLGCLVILLLVGDQNKRIEYMAIFLVLVGLSAVDGNIRKIPNELLLLLLVFKVAAMILERDASAILPSLAGLAVGYFLFLIPAQFGISIGWGDIKLAAASGFCLGIVGLFQAVIIMAGALGLYGLFLTLTKRGNMKTKVAIGPPLSLGMLMSLLFPIAFAF